MSSRWISTSFSRPSTPPRRLIVGVRRLDQRRLAHAARAPQQRVVGRQAAREALGVLDQEVAHPVDPAAEGRWSTRLTCATGASAPRSARQTKASAAAKSGVAAGGRREPLERVGDAARGGRLGFGAAARRTREVSGPGPCHTWPGSSRRQLALGPLVATLRSGTFGRRRRSSFEGGSRWEPRRLS